MKPGIRRAAIACVFAAWVLPRIIPLLLFPGTYSYDSWVHIGATEVILTHNRVPFYGEYYSNLYMPFLHIFAALLHFYFGTSLIDTFRLFSAILIAAGFTSFFALFRSLLGDGWSSIVAMLFFSIEVDVAAQTNSVIPEHLALVFLALMLLAAVSIIKRVGARREWLAILLPFVCILPLTHHLTTYFGVLFTLGLLLVSILSPDPSTRRIGVPLSITTIIVLITPLIFVNPTASSQFSSYSFVLIPCLFFLAVMCSILYFTRNRIWQLLKRIQTPSSKWLFILLGLFVGIGFFCATLLFYPYERPPLWIVFKFGLLSCLLGLGLAIIHVIPWKGDQPSLFGLFVALALIVIGVSFGFTGVLTLIDSALGRATLWVFIGHRHFTFLLLPLSIISSIAIYKLYEMQRRRQRTPDRLVFPALTLLLLMFSVGGIYNLYQPAGGWYPEWMDQSEIGAGLWLRDVAEPQSFVVTDTRLTIMMQGMFPADTNRFQFHPLTQTVLANPMSVRDVIIPHHQTVYFVTSDMMETYFLQGYPEQVGSLECSDVLDAVTSLAKIFARSRANVYWLVT